MCDDYSIIVNENCDESMLNISPLKKSKTNAIIPILALNTPARTDIDEFLMQESLAATANKNFVEERIFSESDSIHVLTTTTNN